MFQCYPLGPSAAVAHNDTVYILLDGPGRVFFETEHRLRIYCNVWSLNGFLIFRGARHFTLSLFLLSDVIFQIVLGHLKEDDLLEVLVF